MQLFFNPEIDKTTTFFTFDKAESKHIIRVLRKKENDLIYITNGKGDLITSKIVDANDKRCQVEILSVVHNENPFNYYLHIAIAPTKNIQRLEWFLEKATEIGISEITPILCERSERKNIKHERLEKVLIAAMKQSLKFYLPKLNELTPLDKLLQSNLQKNKYIAHCMDTDKSTLKQNLVDICSKNKKMEVIIVIGPEGDFTGKEVAMALEQNFKPVSLGESRLRTETAGIVATHSVAYQCE
jgi:16S rRNA (uracil1498-N3)-methyltransferase